MGAYKYIQELWRKKQSDMMLFLLRVQLLAVPPGLHAPPSLKKCGGWDTR
ncbi:60S ribosomal protein L15 [Sigmodon hispidus]